MARARSPQQRAINQQALAEAQALVGALRARGLQVPMDAPKPLFKALPFRCADWFNRRNPVCAAGFDMDRQFLLAYREATMDSLRALERDYGVHLWDPFPVLCPAATCSAMSAGKPLFFDGDHLSGYGNQLLADSFTAQLSALWDRAR